MTEDVGEFTDRAMRDCGSHLIKAAILAEIARRDKESKRPPKKKCRQPPKYV